ncbi:hypothetical protein FZC79_10310 [Rossellomorea vietnamensis]|uniref:Uncharacterized protein n=1 Tax=Rossellomorea vietnamensis TaxID=218284 RepID=A0A5D4KE06_9BACI|nr:hypothetical protein [Rossellomorea vietnamensis]TYR75554.1 hypothetical protein FZC79_10310 [Rossellomorea vietnamensis]
MKITREVEVFHTGVLTPGSKVKVSGYSCMAEKTFDEDIVEVVACTREELTIKHKRRKYILFDWEYTLGGQLEIEMVEHKPLPTQSIPF